MVPVDCRRRYVYTINTCINTNLDHPTVSDGVNDAWFRLGVVGFQIIFRVTKHNLTSSGKTFFFLPQIVHLFFMQVDELAFSCSQFDKIENHCIRSFYARKKSNVDSGR